MTNYNAPFIVTCSSDSKEVNNRDPFIRLTAYLGRTQIQHDREYVVRLGSQNASYWPNGIHFHVALPWSLFRPGPQGLTKRDRFQLKSSGKWTWPYCGTMTTMVQCGSGLGAGKAGDCWRVINRKA